MKSLFGALISTYPKTEVEIIIVAKGILKNGVAASIKRGIVRSSEDRCLLAAATEFCSICS